MPTDHTFSSLLRRRLGQLRQEEEAPAESGRQLCTRDLNQHVSLHVRALAQAVDEVELQSATVVIRHVRVHPCSRGGRKTCDNLARGFLTQSNGWRVSKMATPSNQKRSGQILITLTSVQMLRVRETASMIKSVRG